MTRRRLAAEHGMALVIALMMAGLMLLVGMAVLSFVDQETDQTGFERVRESSLSLAEGALNAQANLLGVSWPTGSASAFQPCTEQSTRAACPDPGSLVRGFTANHDFGTAGARATWSLTVRDNALGNYYDDSATAGQPAWDASGPAGVPDNMVWLRAQANVSGQTRTIVELVRAVAIASNFPRGVVTANHFKTTNSGKKVIVDPGAGPGIVVRCTPGAAGPARGDACLDYVAGKAQVWPNSYTSDTSMPTSAMSASEIDAMRQQAKSSNTWYQNCPSAPPAGRVVFVENGPCNFSGSQAVNAPPASPGMLIVNSGTVTLTGTVTYYGLIYCPNAGGLATDLVTIGGNAQVVGAVVVDGGGGVAAGSSKTNIVYDANVFNVIQSTSNATIVPNSWRELNGP